MRWVTGNGSPAAPSAISVDDWDGDGVREIVVANSTVWDGDESDCERTVALAAVFSGRTQKHLARLGERAWCVRAVVRVFPGADFDRDKRRDIVVTQISEMGVGRVFVYSGADGEELFTLTGEVAGDRFGWAVTDVDDVDGDGVPDLAVGCPFRSRRAGAAGAAVFGRVEIFPGGGRPGDRSAARIDVIDGPRAGEMFGESLSNASGFDDSGAALLAIGAPPFGAVSLGSVHVINLDSESSAAFFAGVDHGAGFGTSVIAGRDLDGDRFTDVVFSSPWRPARDVAPHVGNVIVARGRPRGNAENILVRSGPQPGDSFGQKIAFLDDATGDGLPELMVGAPSWTLNGWGSNVGRVAIIGGENREELRSFRGDRVGQLLGGYLFDAGDIDGNGFADVLFSGRVEGGTLGLALLGDSDGDGVRDACQACSDSEDLGRIDSEADVVTRNYVTTVLEPRACVRFRVEPGRTFRVRANTSGGTVTTLLRWGRYPTNDDFDAEASGGGLSGATITVSEARDQVAYVVIGAPSAKGVETRISMSVEVFEGPVVDEIHPAVGSRDLDGDGTVHAIIEGAGFTEETSFWLLERGREGEALHRMDASDVVLHSSQFAEAVFDLSSAPRARYDLHAATPDGKGSVAERNFAVVTARNKNLYVSLTGTEGSSYRLADEGELTLRYVNVGDTEIDSPIFRVRETKRTAAMRLLEGSGQVHIGQMYILGAPTTRGRENRLAPGEERELRIFFRDIVEGHHHLDFVLSVLTADETDFIDWSNVENPDPVNVSGGTWRRDLANLSLQFGRTWGEYRAAIGAVAQRIGRRGPGTRDLSDLFRYLHAQAQGRPRSAVVGRVVDDSTLAPVAGADIVAKAGEAVVSRTATGKDGGFVLDGLARGQTVDIEVDAHEVVSPSPARFRLPGLRSFTVAGEDLIGVTLRVRPGVTAIPDEFPTVDENGLSDVPLELPEEVFTPVTAWSFEVISSKDPNAKEDDVEIGEDDLPPPVPDDDEDVLPIENDAKPRPRIHYTVLFENSRCITAGTRRVTIVDTLQGGYFDLSTLHVGTVHIGQDDDSKAISIDKNLWEKRRVLLTVPDVPVVSVNPYRDPLPECLDLEPGEELPECDGSEDEGGGEGAGEGAGAGEGEGQEGGGADDVLLRDDFITDVEIEIRLDGDGPDYELVFIIDSCLDGECLDHEGFLPPNDCETHHGEGYVTFSVKVSDQHALDELVENEVAITFDSLFEQTIVKGTQTELTSAEAPPAPTFPLPKDSFDHDKTLFVPTDQTLSWQGSVFAVECRIEVWKLDDDGERFPLPVYSESVTGSQFVPPELWSPLATYEWQVTVIDLEGRESVSEVWTFLTENTPPPPPIDDMKLIGPGEFADVDAGVVLDWDPSSSADEFWEVYTVMLWSDTEAEGTEVAHVGAESSFEPRDLEVGVSYSWQILAVNDGGEALSPVWHFQTSEGGATFRRGDVNDDGSFDLSDAIAALNWLFLGAATPNCIDSVDFDDNGKTEISDPIAALNYLFSGGPGPRPPGLDCGIDPTGEETELGCAASNGCGN